jgi:hypothetical protein
MSEIRIDYGPGYRVHMTKIVALVCHSHRWSRRKTADLSHMPVTTSTLIKPAATQRLIVDDARKRGRCDA